MKIKITPKKIRHLILLLVLVLAGQYTANQALIQRELQSLDPAIVMGEIDELQSDTNLVTKVVDGDTFKISRNHTEDTVRLLSIDTPELNQSTNQPDCYALEASLYLQSLILNQSVILVPDTLQPDRDRYGRLLRYVYLPDNTFVNGLLVQEGYARAYTKINSDHLNYILNLEDQARQQQKGLWSACQ